MCYLTCQGFQLHKEPWEMAPIQRSGQDLAVLPFPARCVEMSKTQGGLSHNNSMYFVLQCIRAFFHWLNPLTSFCNVETKNIFFLSRVVLHTAHMDMSNKRSLQKIYSSREDKLGKPGFTLSHCRRIFLIFSPVELVIYERWLIFPYILVKPLSKIQRPKILKEFLDIRSSPQGKRLRRVGFI